jgi:cytochrome c biogenesis protein CcdA/thiol-disulfide isomerase/thioredoxin
LFILTLVALSLTLGCASDAQAQEEAVVRFYLFYGTTCPHCHEVMDNFLPQVSEKYGDQVEYEYIEVWNDTDMYLALLGLETKLGVPEDRQGSVPALIIGDQVLIGSREIPERLESLIDEYLAQGGVDYPSLDDLPEVVLPTPLPTVQILAIFEPNQSNMQVLTDLFVSLGEEYGSAIEVYPLDTSLPENADILAQLNDALGIPTPSPGTLQVLVDRQMLVGQDEIERELPGLVEKYLAAGGVQLPSLEELAQEEEETTTPMPTPEAQPIYIAYFEKAGCQDCARTNYDLHVVEERFPQVQVERFSIENEEGTLLNEWLCNELGVPAEKHLATPMLFVGQDVLIGTEATLRNLMPVVGKYASTGAERTWDDFDPDEAEDSLIEQFEQWGVLVVLGAGLIDGLNPCAFATLVFLISYLTLTGRQGRDILFVGAAFALGVFLTYLLVGVVLSELLQGIEFLPILGGWVYLLTTLICVTLAIFTFRDFFRARRGQASDMTLKLPDNLRRMINKVIRENVQVQAFVTMSFVLGFVISLIELACTGQVYYPTLVFMTSDPEFANRAFFYLVLYCLMFTVPLVVVFLFSYFGTTSEQLGLFVVRHVAKIKASTAVLFVGLALLMAWETAKPFGLDVPQRWTVLGVVALVIAVGAVVAQVLDKPASSQRRKRRRR